MKITGHFHRVMNVMIGIKILNVLISVKCVMGLVRSKLAEWIVAVVDWIINEPDVVWVFYCGKVRKCLMVHVFRSFLSEYYLLWNKELGNISVYRNSSRIMARHYKEQR